jgi:MOSC domain-containing protein YiiM
MPGRIASINVSSGGVPKRAVPEARLGRLGLEGDRHDDERHHGGPDRAVVLYSLELIRALQREGHPIDVGTTGENLTVSGLDWGSLGPGTELATGAVVLQITRYASPCRTISGSFLDADFMRISQTAHPGWSRLCARVRVEGFARMGDEVRIGSLVDAR